MQTNSASTKTTLRSAAGTPSSRWAKKKYPMRIRKVQWMKIRIPATRPSLIDHRMLDSGAKTSCWQWGGEEKQERNYLLALHSMAQLKLRLLSLPRLGPGLLLGGRLLRHTFRLFRDNERIANQLRLESIAGSQHLPD